MTMQSSGSISMAQAMSECQVGQQQFNAGSSQLSKLAGVSSGQTYAWSYWYGKSFGTLCTEMGAQFYAINYTGSNHTNFERGLYIYRGGGVFTQSGGDNTVTGNYPWALTNGFNISGFYRFNNNLTVMACNCSLDGVAFQSGIGDNVTLTNDISYSVQIGANLWTFYGVTGAVWQGAPRTYVVNLVGAAQRPQPPNGYINGAPPSTGSGSHHASTSHHCFVAGSLVLMADQSWKQVQLIEPGDRVMGPRGAAAVERLHVATVGSERGLLSFQEDPQHIWTSDHPHWARQNGKQWWWSGQPEYLRKAAEIGLITGLNDPASVLSGAAEFASLEGFVNRTPVATRHSPDTKVYVPVVNGSPIIVNGYLTGGFINERQYDYATLDWLDCLKLPA